METSTFEQLRVTMAERLERGNIRGYVEAEVQLERSLMDEATQYFGMAQFEAAAQCWDTVGDLNREIVAELDRVEASPEGDDEGRMSTEEIADVRQAAERLARSSDGYAGLGRGQMLLTRRNPGAAAESFAAAEAAFRDVARDGEEDEHARVFAEYLLALKEFATGNEEYVRADYETAASAFMRARVTMDALFETEFGRPPTEDGGDDDWRLVIEPHLRSEAFAVASQFEKSSYMARFVRGDYEAARDHARNLCELLQQALDALPEDAPTWQTNSIRANAASADADQERAAAFVHREAEEWEEAYAAYERARKSLEQAAGVILRTGLPDAVATQEALMAQASTTIAAEARQARAEQKLKEELGALRSERRDLIDKIKSAGVTVNNVAEATAVAEQNTQVAVQLRESVRGYLPQLRAALEEASIGPAADELKAEATALEASDEPPASFLDRVRNLTKGVADIVKNVGEAAEPVVPILRVLAPMVGLVL
jgi:tetratricopeptide (TPR) repeat protein